MAKANEKLTYQAKLAEQAERYEEMVEFCKDLAKIGKALSVEERNLVSVAYKNVVGAKRASWRALLSAGASATGAKKTAIDTYRKEKVEPELIAACDDVVGVLDKYLIPADDSAAGSVFYLKMKGDYHRYRAEVSEGKSKEESTAAAKASYDMAQKMAEEKGLQPTDPIRLGLALNVSVFHYEIMNQPQAACKIAKDAFDEAITNLDHLDDEDYKDATLIMQLIRDNLTLWTNEGTDEGAA